jgi:hypothetical protein
MMNLRRFSAWISDVTGESNPHYKKHLSPIIWIEAAQPHIQKR